MDSEIDIDGTILHEIYNKKNENNNSNSNSDNNNDKFICIEIDNFNEFG